MADIIDLQSVDYATTADDCAIYPIDGWQLRVIEFGGHFDASINKDLNSRPLHVVILKSYDSTESAEAPATAVPFSPWDTVTPTHTPLTNNGLGTGWYVESNNYVENMQEYTRYVYLSAGVWNGQVAIDFKFDHVKKVLAKAESRTYTVDGTTYVNFRNQYATRGADLILRSSRKERIELWQESGSPATYKTTLGGSIQTAVMIAKFNRYPEY